LSSTTIRKWAPRVILSVALMALAWPASVRAEGEDLDLKARTLFGAGEYRAALEIYASLYAKTLHPTYVRNVGRCYQNLGEPDKAISSFKEYLRKAQKLDAKGRAEVEGYIKEMEELKRTREREGAAPAEKPARPPAAAPSLEAPPPAEKPRPARPPAATPSLEAPAPAAPPPNATVAISAQPSTSRGEDEAPVYTRWWFWSVLGVAATGAVVTAVVLSSQHGAAAPSPTTDLGTMSWPPR
jgi:hypothetical protein